MDCCDRCGSVCKWTSANPNSQSGFSLTRLAISYMVSLVFGTAVFRLLSVQNWTIAESAYFATTIGLSIGYGAIQPIGEECKIFATVYVILGACGLTLLLSVFVRKL